ncbi:hypothetical protein KAW65_05160 [candidate division WOR-3 bacterium]|nr:hypothetical protein [candidate division WOR-3 bacterium]
MSEIEEKIKEVAQKVPRERVETLRAALLHKWGKGKQTVILFPKPEIKEYPSIYLFGILAKDWPGIAGGVTGVMTELGWNTEFLSGVTLPHKEEKLALFTIGVELSDKKGLISFMGQKKIIIAKLNKVSLKGRSKAVLLHPRKVEIFEEVTKLIEQLKRLTPEVITETTKFFESRTREYLEQRNPKDLANLILTNYDFIDKVRESGGKPQMKVEHLKTKKEKLTSISIACFNRDFSLRLALDAIKEAVPDYNVLYNKEFITDDGISVYRIEIDGFQTTKLIKNSIIKKIVTRKFEKVRLMEAFGGFEYEARVLNPKLIKEHSSTGIPQVYISVEFTSEYFIQFKIIVVKKPSPEWINICTKKLDSVKGFSILGCETPKLYGNSELSIIELRVNTDIFLETKAIYAVIKKNLESLIGNFRDFDKGMRELDVKKFEEIKQKFKETNPDLLKELYYGIEDFYRIGAPGEETIEIMRLGIKLTKAKPPAIEVLEFNEKCTFLGIISSKKLLSTVLSLLAPYTTTASKIQFGAFNLCLFRIEKQGKSLPQEEIKVITQKLNQILHKSNFHPFSRSSGSK